MTVDDPVAALAETRSAIARGWGLRLVAARAPVSQRATPAALALELASRASTPAPPESRRQAASAGWLAPIPTRLP
jgi:hypothetical protein